MRRQPLLLAAMLFLFVVTMVSSVAVNVLMGILPTAEEPEAAGEPYGAYLAEFTLEDLLEGNLPEQTTLCGEPFWLTDQALREEITRAANALVKKGRPSVWVERARLYDPFISAAAPTRAIASCIHILARIESDYNPKARGKGGDKGMYQFLKRAAMEEGLVVVDEEGRIVKDFRFDPRRSTIAATNRFRRACDELGACWKAFAFHNAGPKVKIWNAERPIHPLDERLAPVTRNHVITAVTIQLFEDATSEIHIAARE